MKNKKKFRIILVLLLLGVTLGYAVLGANLTINGNSKLSSSTWDIHFNNVVPKTGSVTLQTGDHGAVITQGDNTEVTYAVTLSKPGDFYEFNVDAVNAGTVDGMIDTITSTYKIGSGEVTPITSSNLPAYLSYSATYSDGGAIAQNHLLKAGETETYKVRIEFKRDIENNQLPSTEQTITFNFAVDYVQADSNGIPVLHQLTTYTANIYDGEASTINDGTNTSAVWIGQAIPNGITTYQTPALAMAALKQASGGTTDIPLFLKHTVTNNSVTDSYVGFVVTDAMVQENPGMTAGTYYLKGKKIFEYINNDWQCMSQYDDGNGNCMDPDYNTNKATLLSAFGSSYCTDNTYSFRCSVSGLIATANSLGYVHVSDDFWGGCSVDNYGDSYCGG